MDPKTLKQTKDVLDEHIQDAEETENKAAANAFKIASNLIEHELEMMSDDITMTELRRRIAAFQESNAGSLKLREHEMIAKMLDELDTYLNEGKVPLEKAEDQLDAIEKILGVYAENTGGNVMCFVFYGSKNGKKEGVDLFFGYANGGLGFNLYDNEEGQSVEDGEMPEDSDFSAQNQANYIREVAKRLGYAVTRESACNA